MTLLFAGLTVSDSLLCSLLDVTNACFLIVSLTEVEVDDVFLFDSFETFSDGFVFCLFDFLLKSCLVFVDNPGSSSKSIGSSNVLLVVPSDWVEP